MILISGYKKKRISSLLSLDQSLISQVFSLIQASSIALKAISIKSFGSDNIVNSFSTNPKYSISSPSCSTSISSDCPSNQSSSLIFLSSSPASFRSSHVAPELTSKLGSFECSLFAYTLLCQYYNRSKAMVEYSLPTLHRTVPKSCLIR